MTCSPRAWKQPRRPRATLSPINRAAVLIGVVAFSESGFSVQVPTNDQAAILAAIDRLAPTRGTSLASGILMALNALTVKSGPAVDEVYSNLQLTPTPTPTPVPKGTYTSGAIIMLTDGENTAPPDPLEAAQTAIDRGVRIYPIGIGSTGGTTLKVNGFTVRTHLDEADVAADRAVDRRRLLSR